MRCLWTIAIWGLAVAFCSSVTEAQSSAGSSSSGDNSTTKNGPNVRVAPAPARQQPSAKPSPPAPNALRPALKPLVPGAGQPANASSESNPSSQQQSTWGAACPYSYGYPYGYVTGYGYADAYYDTYYPYSDYYWVMPGTSAPIVFPPRVVSAEQLYGPEATRRFFGSDNTARRTVAGRVDAGHDNVDEDDAAVRKSSERGTNAQSVASAWKYIGYGDAQFAKHNYSGANERYRKAAGISPQLPEVWFREGFALVGTSHYEAAVTAIQRGLKIDRNWPASNFHLVDLYGVEETAKNAHMEALATAAEENPNDANVLFLIGVYLHFDGHHQRAEVFFRRALEVAGPDTEHIRAFLPK